MPDDLRDQFPKVREVVKALRIPVYELAGYEADDVIGTLTVEAERRGLDTTIVTGDLDMLQLVTDHDPADDDAIRASRTRSSTTPRGSASGSACGPDQMIDYKALKGDPTDNIPGVPGVGEKTAAKLIREFGDARRRSTSASTRSSPTSCARSSSSTRAGVHGQGPHRRSSATCRSSSTSRRRGSATTTARRSSGCSASTSSGR